MSLSRFLTTKLQSKTWCYARLLSSSLPLRERRTFSTHYFPRHGCLRFEGNKLLVHNVRNLAMTGIKFLDEKNTTSFAAETSENFFIPEPPVTPDAPLVDPSAVLNHLGEPTFKSLDLGTSYFPSDFFLNFFETLHVSMEMPWWLAIGVATLCVRLALFPLIVYHRKKSILFQNNMPTMQKLQDRLQKAQLQNNILEMMHVNRELSDFAARNEMISMKNLLVLPGINIMVLFSCLSALRAMANYPVTSLQDGGLLWFTNLCLPDSYFVIPAACCSTIYLIFWLGVDLTRMSTSNPAAKYIMSGLPVVFFFFVMNMPAAVTYYFMVSNCISLLQTAVLRLPAVRKGLNIPMEVGHQSDLTRKASGGGFMKTFRESSNRAKMLRMVQERERLDDERFREAGKAVVQKTVPEKRRPAAAKATQKELRKA